MNRTRFPKRQPYWWKCYRLTIQDPFVPTNEFKQVFGRHSLSTCGAASPEDNHFRCLGLRATFGQCPNDGARDPSRHNDLGAPRYWEDKTMGAGHEVDDVRENLMSCSGTGIHKNLRPGRQGCEKDSRPRSGQSFEGRHPTLRTGLPRLTDLSLWRSRRELSIGYKRFHTSAQSRWELEEKWEVRLFVWFCDC